MSFVFVNSREIPDVVSDLNVDSYLGHWKTVYQAPTNFIFQGYGTCITADYGLLENGNINVINTQLDAPSLKVQQSYQSNDPKNILDIRSRFTNSYTLELYQMGAMKSFNVSNTLSILSYPWIFNMISIKNFTKIFSRFYGIVNYFEIV